MATARAIRHVPQADSRVRPLDRRWAMMARPALVRMRSRKPWVFARRRLFGWYVRLLTSASPSSVHPGRRTAGVVAWSGSGVAVQAGARTAGIRHPIRGRRMNRTSVRRVDKPVNDRHGGSIGPNRAGS
jgi:hypothetical protein